MLEYKLTLEVKDASGKVHSAASLQSTLPDSDAVEFLQKRLEAALHDLSVVRRKGAENQYVSLFEQLKAK